MRWQWVQSTGQLLDNGKEKIKGYSGAGEHKNKPESQQLHNLGPIPCGIYEILPPRNTVEHGPYVLPLHASAENTMFGRGGFLIHGDSIKEPGTASQGCIIIARAFREALWKSEEHEIEVIP